MTYQVSWYSAEETVAIQATCTVTSVMSIAGLFLAIRKIYAAERKPFDQMVGILLNFQLIDAVLHAIGLAASLNDGACITQGFFIQYIYSCQLLWMLVICFQLYMWIVKKKHPDKLFKNNNRLLIITLILSIISAFVVFRNYGVSTAWCWTVNSKSFSALFLFYYTVLLLVWVVLFAVFIVTSPNALGACSSVWKKGKSMFIRGGGVSSGGRALSTLTRQNSFESTSNDSSVSHGSRGASMLISRLGIDVDVITKLRQYLAIFLFTWFFSLLNRGFQASNTQNFLASYLVALIMPLQGLFYAACYTNGFGYLAKANPYEIRETEFVDKKRSKWTMVKAAVKVHGILGHVRKSRRSFLDVVTGQKITVGNSKNSGTVASRKMVKSYSVFASTFNCAEANLEDIEANLSRWVLLGHDIYAIAVQECTCLDGLRKAIMNHLNSMGDVYEMKSTEIGSNDKRFGYHGFIGLTLFVRSSDLNNDYIELIDSATNKLATGKDLVITTAENKGAVGLHIQIFDTNICFLGSHLPSDSKGVTKLHKRNDSVDTILTQFVCAPEDAGFNLQLQHDHVIFMGDLNYRMECNEENTGDNYLTATLETVSEALVIEKTRVSTTGGDEWFQRRYDILRSNSDPLRPQADEMRALQVARQHALPTWEKALDKDELRVVMATGTTFFNFHEPLPTFPPSYKREQGLQSDCGDYTDMRKIIDGFILSTHKGGADDSSIDVGQDHRESFTVDIFDNHDDERIEMTTNPLAKAALEARLNGDKELESERALSSKKSSEKRLSSERKASSSLFRFTSLLDDKNKGSPRVRSSNQGKIASAKVKKNKKNERPPSYTDRILIHSLAYYKNNIKVVGYEACDAMLCSDHKPVSMVFNVEVNAACRTVDKARNGTVMLFELLVKDMHVEYFGVKDLLSSIKAVREKKSSNDLSQIVESFFTIDANSAKHKKSAVASGSVNEIIDKVQVVFPLPTKDPIIRWKKRHQLNKVFRSEYTFNPILAEINKTLHTDGHSCSPDELESIMDLVSDFAWHPDSAITDDLRSMNSSKVQKLACVSPNTGVQILIKLVSKDDQVIGQTNVCLNRLLSHLYQQDDNNSSSFSDIEKGIVAGPSINKRRSADTSVVRSSLASYVKRISHSGTSLLSPDNPPSPDKSEEGWVSITSEVIHKGHLSGSLNAKYMLVPMIDVTNSVQADLAGTNNHRESQQMVTL